MVSRPSKPRGRNLAQAQLDPDLQRRKATWRDSEIQEKVMWDDLSEGKIQQALSIAIGAKHPLWDGLGYPTKDALTYMQALQGRNGVLFKDALNRSTENHLGFLKNKKPDERINDQLYSSFFDWWRQFLLAKNLAMVLPFKLATVGEPFFTPSDVRFVQRAGNLYVYWSSKKPDLYLPSYQR